MHSLEDILKDRLESFKKNPVDSILLQSKQYQKDWSFAVSCFQKRINKDRKVCGQTPLSFIAIRMKLVALKEIDDLRWFYRECLKYSKTKDKQGNRNTFSKCFFGSLK